MSDPLAELRETFFLECDELLEKLETDLLALEAGSEDEELVNSAFRAVHSIKGGAGAFGMSGITDCAHIIETTMDHVRSGGLKLDPELCALLLRGKDLLASLVAAENGGPPADEEEAKTVTALLEEACPEEEEFDPDEIFKPVSLAADLGLPSVEEPERDEEGDAAAAKASDPLDILAQFEAGDDAEDTGFGDLDPDAPAAPKGELVVAFAPKDEFYARGNDAAPFIRELKEIGEADVMLDASRLPDFDDLDPAKAYLEWTICLDPSVERETVEEIFDFVAEDCAISYGESLGLSADPPAEREPEAQVFIDFEAEAEAEAGAETEEDTAKAEDGPSADEDAPGPASEAGPAASEDAPEVGATASADEPSEEGGPARAEEARQPEEAKAQQPQRAQPKPVVRVELGRVDRLINLVSELVISQSMLTQAVEDQHSDKENQALLSGLDEFRALTRELQESVMAIRAEPVRSMFMRMGQIARSSAQVCGKKVRLETEGEMTEVDKTVIERLTEPLTHMIRNAVDHGIEAPEDRVKAGKDEQGTVRLSAEHHSGRVVISVIDDGGGVNRTAVRKKAVEKGIISEDAQLSDSEIDQLLFAPGFSTAATISQVSGRGVGMDVVKREINALGGRIAMSSNPGTGTSFTISLPLTLAVLDGMVIKVAEQTVVLPLSVCAESLRPEAGDIQRIGGNDQVIYVRGSFVPILDVGAALGYRAPSEDFEGMVMLLVENDNGVHFAFAVDDIVDQRQVVIKGLQDNYGHIEGVAAATILGDGQIALILDVDDLTTDKTNLGSPVPIAGAA